MRNTRLLENLRANRETLPPVKALSLNLCVQQNACSAMFKDVFFGSIYDGCAQPPLPARGQHPAEMPLSWSVPLEQSGISNDLVSVLDKKVNAVVVNVIELRFKDMLLAHKYVKPCPDNLKQFGQRQFAE